MVDHGKKLRRPHESPESKLSTATTVFWLLCVMCALAAELLALVSWWALRNWPGRPVELIHHLSVFISFLMAIMALFMLPVVCRTRAQLPPRSVIVFAVGVCLCGLAVAVAAWLLH